MGIHDRPVAEEAAREGMPVPPGTVHVFGPCGCVQRRQLPSQARGMSGLDPATRAGLEEALNALVPEASNHPAIVAHSATRSKCSSIPMGGANPQRLWLKGIYPHQMLAPQPSNRRPISCSFFCMDYLPVGEHGTDKLAEFFWEEPRAACGSRCSSTPGAT